MKRLTIVGTLALMFATRVIASSLSSTEIQAAVREAAELYRGDFPERAMLSDRYYFYGSLSHDIRARYLAVFAEFPFTRSLMDTVTPNHALQPTADPEENYKDENKK